MGSWWNISEGVRKDLLLGFGLVLGDLGQN